MNDHDLYLLRAFLTHAVVGYGVVRGLTDLPPAVGVVGTLTPDVDLYLGPVLGLPVVHRGVLHTPAALVVLTGGVLLVGVLAFGSPRRIAAAFGLGFLSHLLVDSFTSVGVMWLFPASPVRVALDLPIHGAPGTVALWLASLTLVLAGPRLRARVSDGGEGTSRE